MGSTFKLLLCKILNIEKRDHIELSAKRKSLEGIKHSEKSSSEASKKRRKYLKYHNVGADAKRKGKEGSTYAAGNFNQ